MIAPPTYDTLVDLLMELNESFSMDLAAPGEAVGQVHRVRELIQAVVDHARTQHVQLELCVVGSAAPVDLQQIPDSLLLKLGTTYQATARAAGPTGLSAVHQARTPGLALLRAYMELQERVSEPVASRPGLTLN